MVRLVERQCFFLPLTLRHTGIPSFNYNVNAHGLASADKLGTKSAGTSLQSVSTN